MSPAVLLLAWLLSIDGGLTVTPPAKAALSPEDQEVVQHLDLLESLDAAGDMDLLEELSIER